MSIISFVFISCEGDNGDNDPEYYTEIADDFAFKLSDDSAMFKSVYYNSIKEQDVSQWNQTRWRILLEPTTTQVVFETDKGWDTIVYRVVLSGPNTQTKYYGNEVLTMKMKNPEILFSTFDSVYYQQQQTGYSWDHINLILVK